MTATNGLEPLRILVVDDASVMRMLLRHMLMRLVYANITEARDGAAAIKLTAETRFDIVFLDINMPQVTGLTVLDGLRRSARYKDTPIVLLTTLGQEKDRDRGIALGASAYMLKPLREMELVRVMRRLVPAAVAARSNEAGKPDEGV